MNKFKETFSYLMQEDKDLNVSRISQTHFYASLVMAVTALIMTIQNVRNESWVMAVATTVLVVGMVINLYITGVLRNYKVSSVLITILAGILLSAFVIIGGNEGFACLWILLVPMLAVTLLGIVPGVALSLYFMVFILILFYTPLREIIVQKYTVAHMQRFPVLYACDMFLSLYISLQKEYFYRKMKEKSFLDELTGAYNRNSFQDQMTKTEILNSEHLSVLMIDLNGLKKANDTLGHAAGDELLIGLVKIIKDVFGSIVNLFRVGGDEFVIILNQPKENVEQYISDLEVARANWKGRLNSELKFALGCASKEEFPDKTPDEIIRIADERMYADKAEFYKKNDRRR
ncbi:MAG: GGDEF domain-containing protein [Mogibacterium sp.]|nr:GGDEF domain-containing protein [Mogibacterium sp.]